MGTPTGGSAFFVSVPSPDPSYWHIYAVTCRHIIVPAKADPALTMRLNLKGGGIDVVETTRDEWSFPTSGDDLAVRLCHLDPKKFDCSAESVNLLITDEIIKTYELGIGDEAFSVGRFLDIESATENRPVVRFGQIAALPPVSVVVDKDHTQQSYLVDMRSRSGFSGSAVYAYIDPSHSGQWVSRPATKTAPTANLGLTESKLCGPWILGVHWGQMPVAGPEAFGLETRRPEHYGSGIAAVVPAQALRAFLLEDEDLKRAREAIEKEWFSRPRAVQEGAARVEPETDNPSHKEDFTRLLGAAVKEKK